MLMGPTLYLLIKNTLSERLYLIDAAIKENSLAVGAGSGGFDRYYSDPPE